MITLEGACISNTGADDESDLARWDGAKEKATFGEMNLYTLIKRKEGDTDIECVMQITQSSMDQSNHVTQNPCHEHVC